jgi:hypothetical protein
MFPSSGKRGDTYSVALLDPLQRAKLNHLLALSKGPRQSRFIPPRLRIFFYIIRLVRLLALRPLLGYCASLRW